jgi:hypothetical protein
MTEFKVVKINDNCYIEYKQEQYVPQCYLITLSEHKYMKILLYDDDLERLMHALQECLHITNESKTYER